MKRILSALFCLALLGGTFTVAAEPVLFIGELGTPDSGVTVSSGCTIARTTAAYEGGSVIGKPLRVNSSELLEGAVDMTVRLSEECFLDHISFSLTSKSGGARLQVLLPSEDGGRPVTPDTALSAGENTVVVDASSDVFILRFHKEIGYLREEQVVTVKCDYDDFVIKDLKLFGAAHVADCVYPTPESLSYTGGWLENVTGVTAPKKCGFPADNFCEKYRDLYGVDLPRKKGNVSFALAEMPAEAFSIAVTPTGAVVKGGSERALLYASEKLLQLSKDGRIRCAEINDKPAFPIRGFHFALPAKKEIEYVERLVKYVLMPLGYNTVILQVSGVMEYKRHPEINQAWEKACRLYEEGKGPKPAHYGFLGSKTISQDEVRELCSYIRKYGMEIVPEVQTFGHTQYVTMAHPELAERVEQVRTDSNRLNDDARPDETFFHTSCPNHPDYFKIFFDIIDEVVDVVKPEKYVHIGHDEIYELGLCPLCKAEGAENVYVREVTTIHDYLKSKGVGTMMWSDMMEEKRYASRDAVTRVPKDILCLPFTWYFHLNTTEELEDRLVDNGLQFITGNMYSSHFPRFESRSRKPGYLGGEVSTWLKNDEFYQGYYGKIFELYYTSEMLWSKAYRQDFRRTWTTLIRSRLPRTREYLHYGKPFTSAEQLTDLPLGGSPSAVPYDIRDAWPEGIAACTGHDATIEVGMTADRIHVLHATDIMDRRPKRSVIEFQGAYVLEYEDGTSYEEPLTYAYSFGPYKWAYGAPYISRNFRHDGYPFTYPSTPLTLKTSGGEDATIWDYAVDNPHPGKKIARIRISYSSSVGAKLIIFGARAGKLQ